VLLWSCFAALVAGLAGAGEIRVGERVDLGEVDNSQLDEASGIVVSRRNAHVLWSHNDSGDENRIFALRDDGQIVGIFHLPGCLARDWEDIAIGPGPNPGVPYLYVGDIGDNLEVWPDIWVCRVAEPQVDFRASAVVREDLADVSVFRFRYPDQPKDAEALLVDPLTGDLFTVSKREQHSAVYRAKAPLNAEKIQTLEKVAELSFNYVTGGDISADGRHIVLKTLRKVLHWPRRPGQTIAEAFGAAQALNVSPASKVTPALAVQPQRLPYVREPQGEAIGWSSAPLGYYTISETAFLLRPHLYFYPIVGQ